MSRRLVLLLFSVCAAGLFGVMAWLTSNVRRLEDAQRRSREEAALEESVRLSLWRMESRLVPLMAQENSRPASAPASEDSPFVHVRFQWEANGRLWSLGSASSALATAGQNDQKTDHPIVERLRALAHLTERSTLLAGLNTEWLQVERPLSRVDRQTQPVPQNNGLPVPTNKKEQAASRSDAVQQIELNRQEWQARTENVATNIDFSSQINARAAQNAPAVGLPLPVEVRTGRLQPVWIGQEILLARRVLRGKQELIQGCWLDWAAVRTWLLTSIRDLLPDARLEPSRDGEADGGRRLAALPLRLVPGRLAIQPAAGASTLRLPLAVAWALAGISVLAVGALLWGIATLSERRAAFVSAVTHELRTPLTTFRMYSDMLAEGMIRDDEQKRQYLTTLQREAERQSHLVENVLAYSRLERGRGTAARERVIVADLLSGLLPTLAAQAERSGMQIMSQISPETASLLVQVDRSAVERILFNLVDNACKYARGAEDKRIHLECDAAGPAVRIVVADHGPGIGRNEIRRLFRPFRKSAREAAQTAPGVGLGLALSRRLARAIGGDLSLLSTDGQGTRFYLQLPRP